MTYMLMFLVVIFLVGFMVGIGVGTHWDRDEIRDRELVNTFGISKPRWWMRRIRKR